MVKVQCTVRVGSIRLRACHVGAWITSKKLGFKYRFVGLLGLSGYREPVLGCPAWRGPGLSVAFAGLWDLLLVVCDSGR